MTPVIGNKIAFQLRLGKGVDADHSKPGSPLYRYQQMTIVGDDWIFPSITAFIRVEESEELNRWRDWTTVCWFNMSIMHTCIQERLNQ